MRLALVHHADAVGSGVDPQRPLSSIGLEQADQPGHTHESRGVLAAGDLAQRQAPRAPDW